MQIVNLTDKPITIVGSRGQKVKTITSSGLATCDVEERREGDVDGVPIISKVYGRVQGLPAPKQDETMYIVSPTVAKAVGDSRFDLLLADGGFMESGELLHRALLAV